MTSRFRLVTHPAKQPACDIVTSGTAGPFIDTGRDLKFQDKGRVYLSVPVLKEMAIEAGIASDYTAKDMKEAEEAAFNRGYWAALEENQIELLRDSLDRLAQRIDSVLDSGIAVGDPSDEGDDSAVGGSVKASDGDGGQDDSDAGEPGSDDVSSDSGNGEPQFQL